ncbi:MAG: hypothetical protein H6737_09145 [Alphaproteobacteria bacterium]|nr:hypothetical protein [Alphaproteobacteria bacterium]
MKVELLEGRAGTVASTLGAAMLLLQTAAFNRTPLLFFGDSAGYLRAAMSPAYEPHSYMYSLFVRYASLGYSTWAVVGLQALLLAGSMRLFLKACSDHTRATRNALLLGLSAILALVTPLSKLAGRMTPDAFAPILLFLFLAVLHGRERLHVAERVVAGVLLVVLFFTHTSHWMVFIVAALGIAAGNLVWSEGPVRDKLAPLGLLAGVLPLAMGFQLVMNLAHEREHRFSPGSHVMLAAVFSETGALKQHLDAHCAERHYALCDTYTMPVYDSGYFLWSFEESPFYAAYTPSDGKRMKAWDASKPELTEINRALLLRPGTWAGLAFRGAKNGVVLLNRTFHYESDYRKELPRWEMYDRLLLRYLPIDAGNFERIKQGSDVFSRFEAQTHAFFRVSLTLAYLVLLGLAVTGRLVPKRATLEVAAFVGANALVCGALSGIAARYNERFVWVFVLLALLACFEAARARWGEPIG